MQGTLEMESYQKAGEAADLRMHREVQRSSEEPIHRVRRAGGLAKYKQLATANISKEISENQWNGAG